jgi:hypothetical protein
MLDMPGFCDHRLWASIMVLPDEAIKKGEESAIRTYFNRFLELPPYNGAFPGR